MRSSRLLAPVLTGLCYFAVASLSRALTHGEDALATMRPASGLLLAVLLVRRRRIVGPLGAAAVASLAASLLDGEALRVALGFTVANVAAPAIAALLVGGRIGAVRLSLVDGRHLAIFCAAAAFAASASAVLASVLSGRIAGMFPISWFSGDLLGMLIVTPMLLIAHEGGRRRGRLGQGRGDRPRSAEALGVVALLVAVTAATFATSSYAAFFLPMAALLLAVFRLGMAGAALGVFVIAAIGSVFTALGIGPVMLLHATAAGRGQFLQLYLLTLFAAALPMAALLHRRERLIEDLTEKNRLRNYAETAARLGHWRMTLPDHRLFLSEEVHRILGLEPSAPVTLEDAFKLYAAEDAARVKAVVGAAIRSGRPYEFRSRLVRPDGKHRHIIARGECERDAAGEVIGIFGMVQDVTREVEDALTLQQARLTAERAAQDARAVADTDALTGLPNRRMVLRVLETALDEAERGAGPLAVALLDIDHFKRVNDHHGHLVGDAMLRTIARSIAAAIRTTDLVGRYGGEEFLLVLPHSAAGSAAAIAERVRDAIERGEPNASQGIVTTASIGVALAGAGETLESLLRRADTALYEAKHGGRNQVRLARAGAPSLADA